MNTDMVGEKVTKNLIYLHRKLYLITILTFDSLKQVLT